jgi:hypothetical protein
MLCDNCDFKSKFSNSLELKSGKYDKYNIYVQVTIHTGNGKASGDAICAMFDFTVPLLPTTPPPAFFRSAV